MKTDRPPWRQLNRGIMVLGSHVPSFFCAVSDAVVDAIVDAVVDDDRTDDGAGAWTGAARGLIRSDETLGFVPVDGLIRSRVTVAGAGRWSVDFTDDAATGVGSCVAAAASVAAAAAAIIACVRSMSCRSSLMNRDRASNRSGANPNRSP